MRSPLSTLDFGLRRCGVWCAWHCDELGALAAEAAAAARRPTFRSMLGGIPVNPKISELGGDSEARFVLPEKHATG